MCSGGCVVGRGAMIQFSGMARPQLIWVRGYQLRSGKPAPNGVCARPVLAVALPIVTAFFRTALERSVLFVRLSLKFWESAQPQQG